MGGPQLQLPKVEVKRLRLVQVLPKTTPHANEPQVGIANASPGKQVLGTVPVEADGSAYLRAPAGIPFPRMRVPRMTSFTAAVSSTFWSMPACIRASETSRNRFGWE